MAGLSNTIGLMPVSKTLRNRLIPVGNTMQNINKYGILTDDELRATKRAEIIILMNEYYRDYINTHLECALIRNLDELADAIEKNMAERSTSSRERLSQAQANARMDVFNTLRADEYFEDMFTGKFITNVLPAYIENTYTKCKDDKMALISLFNRSTTSFADFFRKRKVVFTPDARHGSVCFRAVNDNFQIFYTNLKIYDSICGLSDKVMEEVKEKYAENFGEYEPCQIFSTDFYNMLLGYEGITWYNNIISSINLSVNLYCQKNNIKFGAYKMRPLYKQILQEKSEFIEKFNSDKDVYDAVNIFISNASDKGVINKLLALGSTEYDIDKIYVSSKYFSEVSSSVTHSRDTLEKCLYAYNNSIITGKGKAKESKVKKAVKDTTVLSLGHIVNLINDYSGNRNKLDGCGYTKDIVDIIGNYTPKTFTYNEYVNLRENKQAISSIKDALDVYINIIRWLKTFIIDEVLEKDDDFYTVIEDSYNELRDIVPLYNKVRNYVTKKPYNTGKIKLTFGTPAFASGWSKELISNALILRRDGKYYLGILNALNKPKADDLKGHISRRVDDDFEKMIYNLLPGANKMLPKVCFSNKGMELFRPSKELIAGYQARKHIKSDKNFDKEYLYELIDFFKYVISIHPEWKNFEMQFTDTRKYNDISEFYKEVEAQGYSLRWTYISKADMDAMVNNGQIYLFQIYNKDFNDNSTGTKNLHTLYFENIFSEDNLKNVVIKLNGGAEVFFRKASIKNPVVHKKGSILVNKTYTINSDGSEKKYPVPDAIYTEIYKYLNKMSDMLSDEAKRFMPYISYHEAKFDIVKDRRYVEDQFQFHVPVTINFKARKAVNINDIALEYIANNDVNVIGINRGERNLISVAVIDPSGNILEQKSFNVINGYDYKKKLVQKEKERDTARKNWQDIGKITEIKEGYLSHAIHEIAHMVIKYNAVIAMEDLTYGFKRGRFKIERQVYQKFEYMFVKKLNYLVDKSLPAAADGGVLKGYQLTYEPDTVTSTGRQNGFIFYVPTGYTSKIDPSTGFADVFNRKGITTIADKQEFLLKMDSIRFDAKRRMFYFKFDYNKFDTYVDMPKTSWTVWTNGERVKIEMNNGHYNSKVVDITRQMQNRLAGIDYEDGHDLKEDLSRLNPKNVMNGRIINDVYDTFCLATNMRNRRAESEDEDYDVTISPIMKEYKDNQERFFDTKHARLIGNMSIPTSGDANDTYCIALKGLQEVFNVKQAWLADKKFDRELLKISHEDWFAFVQSQAFRVNM